MAGPTCQAVLVAHPTKSSWEKSSPRSCKKRGTKMRERTRNTACPCMFLHVPKKNSDSIEMNLKKSRNWLWVSRNKQAVIFLGPFPFTNVHASWKPSGKRWARLSCPANSLTFQPVKIPDFLTSKNVDFFTNERVELGTSALDTHSNFLSINFWRWLKKIPCFFFAVMSF